MKKEAKEILGLSLTELLVATALMGIILLGVVSIDMASRVMNQSTSRNADTTIRLSAAMEDMKNQIQQAIGHDQNRGLVVTPNPASGNIAKYIHVRQDIDGTPSNYGNDLWVSYTIDAEPGTLVFCDDAVDPNIDPTAACNNATTALLGVESGTFNLVTDTPNLNFYIQVDLTRRFDTNSASESMLNPEHTQTIKVSPLAHSW